MEQSFNKREQYAVLIQPCLKCPVAIRLRRAAPAAARHDGTRQPAGPAEGGGGFPWQWGCSSQAVPLSAVPSRKSFTARDLHSLPAASSAAYVPRLSPFASMAWPPVRSVAAMPRRTAAACPQFDGGGLRGDGFRRPAGGVLEQQPGGTPS